MTDGFFVFISSGVNTSSQYGDRKELQHLLFDCITLTANLVKIPAFDPYPMPKPPVNSTSPRTSKQAVTLIFALLSILYPCLVYFGLQHWSYRIFGFMIIGVGLGKFWLSRSGDGRGDRVVLAVTLLCGLTIWAFPSELAVKLYPVCVSALVGSLFALSLRQKESLIEKFARLRGAEMTPEAIRYTRNLTAIWAILLYANALVALYLARFGTTEAWTLYCGLLSYLILGGFMGAELLYRQYYMRRLRVRPGDDNSL